MRVVVRGQRVGASIRKPCVRCIVEYGKLVAKIDHQQRVAGEGDFQDEVEEAQGLTYDIRDLHALGCISEPAEAELQAIVHPLYGPPGHPSPNRDALFDVLNTVRARVEEVVPAYVANKCQMEANWQG